MIKQKSRKVSKSRALSGKKPLDFSFDCKQGMTIRCYETMNEAANSPGEPGNVDLAMNFKKRNRWECRFWQAISFVDRRLLPTTLLIQPPLMSFK